MARKGFTEEAAKEFLEKSDRIRASRIRELFKIDWRDPTRYDMVISTSKTSVDTAAQTIAEVSQREEYRPTAESVQAMRDLTITTRVKAVLALSRLNISNLQVESRGGEVYAAGLSWS